MKKLKFLTFVNFISWFILSFITIFSIFFSSIGWIINLSMGLFFALISIYIFFKEKNLITLLLIYENKNKIINYEIVFLIFMLLISIVTFLGIYHRVFIENLAVFG